jgi:tetratricopeptide (TPR) repeat protein
MWHDPDDRIRKAAERFEEDDVRAARRMLRALERQGVESPRIDLYLGHCHLEEGNAAAALARYKRSALRAPRRAEPWVGMGLAYGRLGKLRRARSAFRRAARLAPDLEEAHCQLVHCHVLLGELESALRVAKRVHQLDPRCANVHRHLAVGFALADRHEEALLAWRRVEDRDPDHRELRVGLARSLARLRRVDEARSAYLRALALDPADPEARVGLGDLAVASGRADEALDHYRAAVEADPADVEARLRWVEALADAGRPAQALDVLASVEDADDLDEVAVTALTARALADLGRRRAGLALLRALVRRRPATGDGWRSLGDFLLVRGRPRAAVTVLRRAVRVEPDSPEGPRLLARALARARRGKEAVAVLARAAWRDPRCEDLHVDVAAALVARGRREGAERAILRGISHLPDSATLWAAAAELSFDAGRLAEARGRLRAALRRDRRHPQALSVLVRLLVARKEWRRAVHAGRAAEKVVSPSDPALRDYATALLRLSRAARALPMLRRYVLRAAGDPDGYRAYADALEAVGDPGGASAQRRIAAVV